MNEPVPAPENGPPRGGIGRSFAHAWEGLVDATIAQRNMRIHLALGALACAFAAAAPIAGAERAVLLACVGLVIGAEAANTALEALVDLQAPGVEARARVVKDAAAAGVLALAFASVLVLGAIVTARWDALRAAWPALAASGLGAGTIATAVLALAAAPSLSLSARVALVMAGLAALLPLTRAAAAVPGAAGALALLAIAAAAARRKARASGQPQAG